MKLEKSKWTSIKKVHGWKHYEVKNIDKKIIKLNCLPYVIKIREFLYQKEELKDQSFGLVVGVQKRSFKW